MLLGPSATNRQQQQQCSAVSAGLSLTHKECVAERMSNQQTATIAMFSGVRSVTDTQGVCCRNLQQPTATSAMFSGVSRSVSDTQGLYCWDFEQPTTIIFASQSTAGSVFCRTLQPLRCDLSLSTSDRFVGLVVKASASRAEDPGFESRLRRDFFGVESYQ